MGIQLKMVKYYHQLSGLAIYHYDVYDCSIHAYRYMLYRFGQAYTPVFGCSR